MDLFNKIYFGNTVLDYITCAGIIILGLILIFIFNRIIEKKQKSFSPLLTGWLAVQ